MEYLLAIILIWAVIFGFVSGAWAEKDIAVAKKAYRESLSALMRAPESTDIRRRTIVLGRRYGELTRGRKGHAVFDEAALMKDIDVACGAARSNEHAHATERRGPIQG